MPIRTILGDFHLLGQSIPGLFFVHSISWTVKWIWTFELTMVDQKDFGFLFWTPDILNMSWRARCCCSYCYCCCQHLRSNKLKKKKLLLLPASAAAAASLTLPMWLALSSTTFLLALAQVLAPTRFRTGGKNYRYTYIHTHNYSPILFA